jgi:hypothetical protein
MKLQHLLESMTRKLALALQQAFIEDGTDVKLMIVHGFSALALSNVMTCIQPIQATVT